MKRFLFLIFASLTIIYCKAYSETLEKVSSEAVTVDLSNKIQLANCYVKGFCGVQQNYDKARFLLTQEAEKGNPEAQYLLGRLLFLYYDSYKENISNETENWLKKAAQQNHLIAKLLLKLNWHENTLTEKETEQAWSLLIKDAESGAADDQYFLGYLYILEEEQKAMPWLIKAAEQGFITAQVELGKLYERQASFTPILNKEAEKWYFLGAEKGYSEAEYHLGSLYSTASVKASINNDEQAEAKFAVQAEKWLLKAADKNYPIALYRLASHYYYGYGNTKDYNKALKWYLKAIDEAEKQNDVFTLLVFNSDAYSKIAEMYSESNYGIKKDLYKAREWYRKASEAENKASFYKYALMCYEGEGGYIDYVEATKWLIKALDEPSSFRGAYGFKEYQSIPFYLGSIYSKGGHGAEVNYNQAQKWFSKLAERGDEKSQLILGILYQDGGYGLKQDYIQAHKWFNISAASGNYKAKHLRDNLGRKMTVAQINEAQRLARLWKLKTLAD
jgi:TPR repeat protein